MYLYCVLKASEVRVTMSNCVVKWVVCDDDDDEGRKKVKPDADT